MSTLPTTTLTADDVDWQFAQRLADALIEAMCKADTEWDRARAKEVRSHMRTALAAVGIDSGGNPAGPDRRDVLFADNPVAATLQAHTWWNDRNACSCGEQPTCEPPYYFNAGGNTDWHALHVAAVMNRSV